MLTIRTCNGAREWVQNPNIEPLPEYECAAYGQDQYRTFDGKWISFASEKCEYQLMEIKGTPNKISAENVECEDSLELQICKKVLIETKKGTVELLQKKIRITLKKTNQIVDYDPGDYPQPCTSSALDNVEITSVGLFIVVRVYDLSNRLKPLYEVSWYIFVQYIVTMNMFYSNNTSKVNDHFRKPPLLEVSYHI